MKRKKKNSSSLSDWMNDCCQMIVISLIPNDLIHSIWWIVTNCSAILFCYGPCVTLLNGNFSSFHRIIQIINWMAKKHEKIRLISPNETECKSEAILFQMQCSDGIPKQKIMIQSKNWKYWRFNRKVSGTVERVKPDNREMNTHTHTKNKTAKICIHKMNTERVQWPMTVIHMTYGTRNWMLTS